MQTPSFMHLSMLATFGCVSPVANCTRCFLVPCKRHMMHPASLRLTLNSGILMEVQVWVQLYRTSQPELKRQATAAFPTGDPSVQPQAPANSESPISTPSLTGPGERHQVNFRVGTYVHCQGLTSYCKHLSSAGESLHPCMWEQIGQQQLCAS